MGQGARDQGLGIGIGEPGGDQRRPAELSAGHGTWGIAIAKGGRAGQAKVPSCLVGSISGAVRDGSVVERQARSGCPNAAAIKDCANRRTVSWVR